MSDLRLEAAIEYAARGWKVFPLHALADGHCTCGQLDCGSVAKHPRTPKGLLDASANPMTIRTWWRRWPNANVGLATGATSGLVVIDLDGDEGADSWHQIVRTLGAGVVPDTVTALTGGGMHLLFAHPGPGVRVINRQGVAPGVDVRGDGGYIVAPPSIHRSGRAYQWELSGDPAELPPAPLPEWLLARLTAAETDRSWQPDGELKPAGPVIAGCGWLQEQILNQAGQSEAAWVSLLSIAARFEDGPALAHQWSREHPKYSESQTRKKFAHAAGGMSPASCQHIRTTAGGEPHCATCPHWGRIKSPIVIGTHALKNERQAAVLADLESTAPPPSRQQCGFAGDLPPLPPEEGLPQETQRFFDQPGQEPGAPNGTAAAAEPLAGGRMTMEAALTLARNAVTAAREDPGAVYETEALYALSLVRTWCAQEWVRLKKALRASGITLGELYRSMPGTLLHPDDRANYAPADGEAMEGGPQRFAGEMLPECPAPEMVVPAGYELRWNGVIKSGKTREGELVETTIAYAPVLITGRMRDATGGEESLLAAWRWSGAAWQTRVAPRDSLMSARGILGLSLYGFPVADDSAKALVGFLSRFEAFNRRSLPCAAVSSHLGWQGDGGTDGFLIGRTLVQPDGTVEEATELDTDRPETWSEKRIQFHGLSDGAGQVVAAFRQRGSYEGWLEAVQAIRGFPRAELALYAAFAAPLLMPLEIANFALDWSNPTTTGKTTVLRVAGSVWGDPDERSPESVVSTWDNSRVYIERSSQTLQSLPLILDDTKRARHPRQVADVIYTVASGRGRGRGTIGGTAPTGTWRTVLLSSGEQACTAFTPDGGVRMRVLAVRGFPFGGQDAEADRLVKQLNTSLCANYGHAGPRFIQWLVQQRAAWTEWRDYTRERAQELAEESTIPEAGRLAEYAALVDVAGEMAHEALQLPWDYSRPVLELWSKLAAEVADASPEIRAVQHIVSWAHSHEATFAGRLPTDGYGGERPTAVISGRWDPGDTWKFIGFLPNVLREALRAEGFEYDAVLNGWQQRGWLEHDAGRLLKMHRLRGDERARLVCLKREAVETHG